MKQIPDEVLDQLLEDCDKPEDILGANGLLASLQKSILERILEAELTDHLGYCKHEAAGRGSGNSRNGHGFKRVLTGKDSLRLEVPRDRNGSFEPEDSLDSRHCCSCSCHRSSLVLLPQRSDFPWHLRRFAPPSPHRTTVGLSRSTSPGVHFAPDSPFRLVRILHQPDSVCRGLVSVRRRGSCRWWR